MITWMNWVQAALTSLLVIRMVVVGFFQPVRGRLFCWAMFTRGSYITFTFTGYDDAGVRKTVDVLDMVSPHNPGVTPRRLERMAAYLELSLDHVSGEGALMDVAGTRAIRVERGCVVF